jgi:acyl-CoA thioesterase
VENTQPDADKIALRVAQHLCDSAPISKTLGIELVHASTHHCRIRMIVRPHLLNAMSHAHGGMLFALADTAMAYLANGGNARAVTQTAHVMFLGPASEGETLTADATILHRTNRTISITVRITNSESVHLVEAHGLARIVGGAVLSS